MVKIFNNMLGFFFSLLPDVRCSKFYFLDVYYCKFDSIKWKEKDGGTKLGFENSFNCLTSLSDTSTSVIFRGTFKCDH